MHTLNTTGCWYKRVVSVILPQCHNGVLLRPVFPFFYFLFPIYLFTFNHCTSLQQTKWISPHGYSVSQSSRRYYHICYQYQIIFHFCVKFFASFLSLDSIPSTPPHRPPSSRTVSAICSCSVFPSKTFYLSFIFTFSFFQVE